MKHHRLLAALSLSAALLALPLTVGAQTVGARTWTRDSIVARLADLQRIHTPEGIEALEQVDVGGTKQWISIRGLNRANPVLLVIHGGPGSPLMATTWAFQKPWEDYFTVVEYDQRGVGKNFVGMDSAAVGKTLSVDRLTRDAEEVVAHVRRRLGKEKVVVLGYSFGSIIGSNLAKRRPEWLHAYVGIGQAAPNGERYLSERVMQVANATHDTAALRELTPILPYPGPSGALELEKALLMRKYARRYEGGWYGKRDFNLYFSLPEWGPEYSQADVDARFVAMRWAETHLVGGDDDKANAPRDTFAVPVILVMGRYDLHTPYAAARIWFDRLTAPRKKFITFERSSHFLMFEEPGHLLVTLVNDVLPLTGEAATFTRLP